jgi:predicted alpha/beta superfamily hydrolase
MRPFVSGLAPRISARARYTPELHANLLVLLALCLLAISAAIGQEQQITISVYVPSATPRDASIFIAGNSTLLGSWDPGKIKLHQQNDSLWTISLSVPLRSMLEFKITRGTWQTEALYVDGVIPSNTTILVASDTVITLRPVTWNDISPVRRTRTTGTGIVGMIRYHHALKGEGLKYDRDLIVWLPPSYSTDLQKRYPVLYMHDGQNVFDSSTSFIGYDWRADEVADSLIRAKAIEEIIIVGINNSPDRIAEYSDTPLGRSYGRFVVNTVKPLIDSVYRTKRSRENTAVMGSSMGGVISFLFTCWYPEVFSKAGCLSTAIGPAAHEKEFEKAFKERGAKGSPRIYLDVGELEPQLVPGNRALEAYLLRMGFREGEDLEFFFANGAVHNEQAWAHRLWRPLKFMFGF